MYFFMCRVAQPVASRQGSVARPWLAAKASHGPQDRRYRGATRREGRLRARSGVAHLAKATSLGRGARLGSGPQTTFAAHEKVHNTLLSVAAHRARARGRNCDHGRRCAGLRL